MVDLDLKLRYLEFFTKNDVNRTLVDASFMMMVLNLRLLLEVTLL